MDNIPPLKKDWVLTQDAFDKLLLSLDSDRDQAAEKFERIRQGLITFFECRGCYSPEDCTDVTMNRVARRLSEGAQIYASNPSSFFFGVARKVLQEYWAEQARISGPLDISELDGKLWKDPYKEKQLEDTRLELERLIECLERCIQSLPEKNRKLVVEYYQGETSTRISNRKELAQELGVPLNALRIRAFRIREKLEECVDNCVSRLSE